MVSTQSTTVLHPAAEDTAREFALASRLHDLAGATVRAFSFSRHSRLSSFPPLVIPAQAGIHIVLPRESCHRPL